MNILKKGELELYVLKCDDCETVFSFYLKETSESFESCKERICGVDIQTIRKIKFIECPFCSKQFEFVDEDYKYGYGCIFYHKDVKGRMHKGEYVEMCDI